MIQTKTFEKLMDRFLNLFCILGLIYQSSVLLNHYMSGKTVVSIRVGRLQMETLPAFTVCMNLLSLEAISRNNENMTKMFSDYQELQRKFTQINSKDEINNTMTKEIKTKIEKIAWIMNASVKLSKMTPYILLNNYSFDSNKY